MSSYLETPGKQSNIRQPYDCLQMSWKILTSTIYMCNSDESLLVPICVEKKKERRYNSFMKGVYTYRTSAVVESDCFVSDSGLETGFLRHQVDSNRPQVFPPLLYYILWLAGQ